MTSDTARLRLEDEPDGYPRTTRSLVASFAARLGALGYVTGGEAIGSQLAGIAALGREVARTADGARLRRALAAGRAGGNGELLWSALRVNDWLSRMPPAPVRDHVRNDLAMLLADDLADVLDAPAPQGSGVPAATLAEPQPVDVLDVLVGMWAYGQELVRAVTSLAADRLAPPGYVEARDADEGRGLDGSLLR